jgi:hypothetical protein
MEVSHKRVRTGWQLYIETIKIGGYLSFYLKIQVFSWVKFISDGVNIFHRRGENDSFNTMNRKSLSIVSFSDKNFKEHAGNKNCTT